MQEVLLITPPFVQLSSPYPATAFLAGVLKQEGYQTTQLDLSILTALRLFSRKGLTELFEEIEAALSDEQIDHSEILSEYLGAKENYLNTIDAVILFLQGRYPQLSYKINSRAYLPEGPRFKNDSLQKHAKQIDSQDDAVHLASLYLDDLVDLCRNTVLPDFGLSSYRESAASKNFSFSEIKNAFQKRDLITSYVEELLRQQTFPNYLCVGITVPFPGCLYMALKIADWLKRFHPEIPIVMGGGYVNTNLRYLKDPDFFKWIHFLTLDDGELPFLRILAYLSGKIDQTELVRTYFLSEGTLCFSENGQLNYTKPYTPDYQGLKGQLKLYFSLKESTNPMHALWSQSLYLKLRMAHGCYHHRCSFCDTNLDYIYSYQAESAEHLVEQVEQIIAETGARNFHFVDEAMPPVLLKRFSLLILQKKLDIVWWGNIRFDLAFVSDLPLLMKRAGCIAVTGGLESANNRILKQMNKFTTIETIVRVCSQFSEAGVLVHGYLIYGFPTETIEETIHSLEIIRQMFQKKILHSAYFHRFSLTIHSSIYKEPEKYGIHKKEGRLTAFSNNDWEYKETNPRKVDQIAKNLTKALYNFNYRNCLEKPITSWFKGISLKQKLQDNFVSSVLNSPLPIDENKKCFWLGGPPIIKEKTFLFSGNSKTTAYELPKELSAWLCDMLTKSSIDQNENKTLKDYLEEMPEGIFHQKKDLFLNELWNDLRDSGLLLL